MAFLSINRAVRTVFNQYPRTLSELINNRSVYGLEFHDIDTKNYDQLGAKGVPTERLRSVYRDYSVCSSVFNQLRKSVDADLKKADEERIAKEASEKLAKESATE